MDVSEELETTGIVVRDNYLELQQVRAVLECARERQSRGEFMTARVGASRSLQRNPAMRGDRTCWLCEPLFAAEQSMLSHFEQLRLQLNRDLYLGLFELEAHYAWYPPGARYTRHIDQPRGSYGRRVSLVLYLNEYWEDDAGGELEMFDVTAGSRRISPVAGRLVCFLSEDREHAVLPARRDRFSVTGWFRARDAVS